MDDESDVVVEKQDFDVGITPSLPLNDNQDEKENVNNDNRYCQLCQYAMNDKAKLSKKCAQNLL